MLKRDLLAAGLVGLLLFTLILNLEAISSAVEQLVEEIGRGARIE